MKRSHQSGISLIVSLVILVVLSMLGVSSFRTVSMQERMGAATYDRNLALQTAESALREAEAQGLAALTVNPSGPPADSGCTTGLCETPAAGDAERWMDGGFAGWSSATALDNPTARAEFFVEYMGEHATVFACDRQVPPEPTCLRPILRATARLDQSGGDRASVMLQSNIRPQ